MSGGITKEELAVLLKYGDKETALLSWWGRQSTPKDDWERRVVFKWLERENAEGKRG